MKEPIDEENENYSEYLLSGMILIASMIIAVALIWLGLTYFGNINTK